MISDGILTLIVREPLLLSRVWIVTCSRAICWALWTSQGAGCEGAGPIEGFAGRPF